MNKSSIAHFWHGIEPVCREFYTRADQPGAAILTVEAATTEAAQQALAKLPLVQLNKIDLDLIPLAPFTNLARLFSADNEHVKTLA